MLRSIVAALALAVCAAAALAAPKWNGAGWYQIEDMAIDAWIYLGPYASEDACKATLPANDDEAEYYCQYL